MREKLIKFKPEMIPMILSGAKTQTRRPVKLVKPKYLTHDCPYGNVGDSVLFGTPDEMYLLTIDKIRSENLHDISRGDAMAEGCPFANMKNGPDPREWFRALWESIYGIGSWQENPLVWVIDFSLFKEANPQDQQAETQAKP